MLYRKELCHLQNAHEADIMLDLLGTCLSNSEHTLSAGFSSSHYFDIDQYVLNMKKAKELSSLIAQKVFEIEAEEKVEFTKLAFIEKPVGPVNLVPLLSTISLKTRKEPIIIRLKRHLHTGSIKGSIDKTDKVLILNDVATTGRSIFEAAQRIWDCGGKVYAALVVIDRLQGGTENLGRKGIQLYSLIALDTFAAKKGKELKEKYSKVIVKEAEPSLFDLGSKVITRIG
jgi:orotate phosphoribosyltransferase